MKKLNLFIFIIPIFTLFSCESNEEIEPQNLTDKEIINLIEANNLKGTPFPEGSKIIKTNDPSTSIIKLPEDVFYVIEDTNGETTLASETSLTCKCTQGTGCSPLIYKGDSFCVMNSGCKVCSQSNGYTDEISPEGKGTLKKSLIQKQNINIVGVLDKRKGVTILGNNDNMFITKKLETNSYTISSSFFNNKEVKEELKNLYELIYNGNIPQFIINNEVTPSDYGYASVNFYGNYIKIPIPKNYNKIMNKGVESTNSNPVDEIFVEDGGGTCKCTQGSGCVYKSMLGAKYCDAGNCKTCTLTL